MAQDAVHFPDGALGDRPALGRRVPQLTERRPGAGDAGQLGRQIGDQGRVEADPLVQPVDRLAGCMEVIELLAVAQPEGVDEIEAGLEIRPWLWLSYRSLLTTLHRLTGYAQETNLE